MGELPIDRNGFMVTNDRKNGSSLGVDMNHPRHESNVSKGLILIIFPNIMGWKVTRHHPV